MDDCRKDVKFRCDFASSTQVKVMLARGWTQVTEPTDITWNLWWCERSEVRNALDLKLNSRQRIPHFRNHYELTRKDYLWRNLRRFTKLLKKYGKWREAELADSMPITFELPNEYRMLVEEYHRNDGGMWIVKPAARSQGKGIFLFRRLKDLVDLKTRDSTRVINEESGSNVPECFVVQKYLENPYLIEGRKFDLRIYVLVTSFRPLKVWLAREGFARLAGELFSLDRIDDSRVHLTNMSIQLNVEAPQQTNVDGCSWVEASSPNDSSSNDDVSTSKRGRKWSLLRVREFLTARHGSRIVDSLFQRIAGVVMGSLQAVQPVMMHAVNSFELYGYDIILDENLKPWLLEINASPALTPTDDNDYRLKYDLFEDVLNVLDIEGLLTGQEIRIGGFDLLWNMGPVWASCPSATESIDDFPRQLRKLNIFLGTKNDRQEQLKRLHETLTAKRKSCLFNNEYLSL